MFVCKPGHLAIYTDVFNDRVGGALAHYAALVIAEDPVHQHSRYKAAQKEQELEELEEERMSQLSAHYMASDRTGSNSTVADHLLETIEEGHSAESASSLDAEGWALQQEEKRAQKMYLDALQGGPDPFEQEQLIKAEQKDSAKQRC